MTGYQYPIDDVVFSLFSVAKIERLTPYLDEAFDKEFIATLLNEAGKLSEQVIAPINSTGDKQGTKLKGDDVFEAKGFKEAFKVYSDSGWAGLSGNPKYGGQGLPHFISTAVNEGVQAACLSFSLCPLLSTGAVEAIEKHASRYLKKLYLPNLLSGKWTGTMNLTESSAGTDLSAIQCKAYPESNYYRIRGQKIFITWGDHQMSENIIHLVLARLPNAPNGIKGISLFLVPKFIVDDNGKLGPRNDVKAISLEHKLGIHASPTCVMSFGEKEGAIGHLVGRENEGIRAMFTMMNNARQSVGLQGLSISERAYQQALSYAKERKQGVNSVQRRARIIEHPDVLRMLMTMKSQIDAMRSFIYVAAVENDLSQKSCGEQKVSATLKTAIYTPIIKGWITEQAQEIASLAIQIHGGVGFIEETGVAQHARDARILPIYEGTNGIQAIDLMTRKLLLDKGESIQQLIAEIEEEANKWTELHALQSFSQFQVAIKQAKRATHYCLTAMTPSPILGTGVAFSYMMLMGYTIGGWLQLRALNELHTHTPDLSNDSYNSWKQSISFYCDHILIRTHAHFSIIESGQGSLNQLSEGSFVR